MDRQQVILGVVLAAIAFVVLFILAAWITWAPHPVEMRVQMHPSHSTNPSQHLNSVDFLIVGGGISGIYIARRLKQFYPDKTILILERGVQIGGRLLDIPSKGPVGLPLGGMRIFPKVQPSAANLVKQLNLETVELPYVPGDNISLLRRIRTPLSKLPLEAKNIYNLRPTEVDQSADALVQNVVTRFLASQGISTSDLDKMWTNPNVYGMNFWRLLLNNLSTEAIQYYKNTSGYNMTVDDVSAASGILESVGITPTADSPQIFIKNGLRQIVLKLAESFHIDTEFRVPQNPHHPVTVLVQTELTNMTQWGSNTVARVQPVLPKNITDTVTTGDEIRAPAQIVLAKNVIFTGQPTDLRAIMATNNTNAAKITMDMIDQSFVSWNGAKVFIEFNQEWWVDQKLGLSTGRSVTDLPIRQAWIWPAPKTMMIYADMINTHFWRELLPSEPFPIWHLSKEVPKLILELQNQLSLMFGVDQKYLGISRVIWRYWNYGGSIWRPVDVMAASKHLQMPLGTQLPVYASNSDYSTWQIWIEGALQYANKLLLEKFNISPHDQSPLV